MPSLFLDPPSSFLGHTKQVSLVRLFWTDTHPVGQTDLCSVTCRIFPRQPGRYLHSLLQRILTTLTLDVGQVPGFSLGSRKVIKLILAIEKNSIIICLKEHRKFPLYYHVPFGHLLILDRLGICLNNSTFRILSSDKVLTVIIVSF